MTMQTDVRAASIAATGALGTPGRVRIKGLYFTTSAGGAFTVTDGSATGVTLLSLTLPIGTAYIPFPGEGILSQADPFITTAATGNYTIFYG